MIVGKLLNLLETEFCKYKIRGQPHAKKNGLTLGFNYSFVLNLLQITMKPSSGNSYSENLKPADSSLQLESQI